MFGAEARKTVSERIKSQVKEISVKDFKCEHCNYSCEKLSTLKKHTQSKHTMQKCKICSKEFKTAMEVIIHVSNEHQEQEEEEEGVQFESTPKSGKGGQKASFVFSESMLDEFL